MKHLLNNLSEEEKNSIRSKHTGGMKLTNENFSRLVNSKLGDSKPLLKENRGLIKEGFVSELTKDQALYVFKDENNGAKGVAYFSPDINNIVFEIGSRKFFIKELTPPQGQTAPAGPGGTSSPTGATQDTTTQAATSQRLQRR